MATENHQATEQQQPDTLRDALDAAFQQHSTDDDGAASDKGDEGAADDAAQREARTRDDRGRFASSQQQRDDTGNAAAPATNGATQQQATTQQTTTPPAANGANGATQAPPPAELKPPASWKPEVREKWGSVDPTVKQEIHRREYEAQQVLQQGAQQRQFVDAFERVVQPYEMFIRAENSTPLQAVQNMMQTAAELRVGTPQSKANLVAGLIKQFAVDIEMLDTLLAGGAAQGGQQAQQPLRDPRFDQFLAQQQQMLAQQQQREDHEVRQQMAAFAEAHEFYRDVASTMADLVEMRTRQGQTVDLEKVYEQACKMHDGVVTILTQRAAAKAGSQQSQAVLRAKRAAASVKGDPTPNDGATVPKDDSIRAAIEAAIESTGRA